MSFSNACRGLLVLILVLVVAVPSVMAQAQGRLSGTIVDENGEPLEGVLVRAESAAGAPKEATTDENGRYQMLGFQTGPWTLTATLDGYQPETSGVSIRQAAPGRADMMLLRVLSGLELMVGTEALEGLDAAALEADLDAADAAFDAEDYDTAIATYNELLSVLPVLTYLQLNIGNAYRAQGNDDMALAAYETLLDDPEHGAQAEVEIARTRLAMGDLDAASGILASAGADASREDLYNLGEVDFAKGDIAAAAGWYEKAAAAAPDWEKPWFKLALVALNQGDMETAKTNFQKVIDIAPNSEEAAQAQATLAALP